MLLKIHIADKQDKCYIKMNQQLKLLTGLIRYRPMIDVNAGHLVTMYNIIITHRQRITKGCDDKQGDSFVERIVDCNFARSI